MKTRINAFLKPIATSILWLGLLNQKTVYGQNYIFGEGTVKWNLREAYTIPVASETFSNADLVILDERTEFYFYDGTSEKIVRNVKYKINSQKGIDNLKHFKTPESFDQGFDSELYQQSRRARIKTPLVFDFKVKLFAARKFSHAHWSNVSVKEKYETIRRIKENGEFSNEELLVLELGSLNIGDVLEIFYESTFNSQYGSNIFYFTSAYPKLKCEFDFISRVGKNANNTTFIVPLNLDSAHTYTSKVNYETSVLVTTKIQLNNIKANSYPLNAFQNKELPHVCVDFKFYRSVANFSNGVFTYDNLAKPKNFEWVFKIDTNHKEIKKVYDSRFATMKKFTAKMPPLGSDSQNVIFFKAICDTFNNFKFLNANHLFYNESSLYELNVSDHIMKRRLPGHLATKIYNDVLIDNQLFYYQAIIQDKRFGENIETNRIHRAYENNLIALPNKDEFVYFIPRENGLKYHFNELPFYFQDVFAALVPMNFQSKMPDKIHKTFKMIKTPKATYLQNKRLETSTIKLNLDSLIARLNIKEELSGQFSTILRHLYLNELIDSTIAPLYFKRCLDKPSAFAQKSKLYVSSSQFPFEYVFNCSEKIHLKDTNKLVLKDWFSFPISKINIPKIPQYKYYFDFDFSDAYDFVLENNKNFEIKNKSDFETHISNDYFNLESQITQNSPNNYLLKLHLVVKQTSIPFGQIQLLSEVLNRLETLNNFTLDLK